MAGLVAGSMETALGLLSSAFRAVPGGLLVPLAAATDVAGALVSGLVETTAAGVTAFAGGVSTAVRGILTATAGAVVLAGGVLTGLFSGLVGSVVNLAGPVLSALGSFGKATAALVVGAGIAAFQGLLGVGALMVGQFKLGFSTIGSAVGWAFTAAVSGVRNTLQGLGTVIGAVAGPVLSALGSFGKAALALLVGGSVAAFQGLIGVGALMVGQFKAGFSTIGSAVGWAFTTAVAVVRNTFEGIGTAVRGVIAGATSLFSGLGSGALAIFSGLVSVISGIAATVGGLLTGIAGVAQSALGGVRDLLEGAVAVGAGLAERAISLLASTVGSVLAPALSALSADLTDWSKWTAGAMQGETVAVRLATLIHAQGEAAGWSAAQLDVMARSMADLGTNSLGQIREAQLTLARFGNVRGLQFAGALEGARQLSAQLGTELPAAALMLGRALEMPGQSLRGLQQAGIVFSANERHMIQWAMKSGDVAGAQDMILSKIAQMGNIAGAVSETTAGHVNRLRITWESVGVAIGKAVLPFATIVVDFLQPIISGFAETMKAFFGGVADSGQGLLASARSWIAENQEMLTGWGRMIGRTMADLITFVGAAFAQLGSVIMAVWESVGGSGEDSAGDVTEAVTGLLATVRAVAGNMGLTWQIATTGLRIAWFETIDFLKARWLDFQAWFTQRTGEMGAGFMDKMKSAASGTVQFFLDPSKFLFDQIGKQLEEANAKGKDKKVPEVSPELAGLRDNMATLMAELKQKIAEAREEAARPPARVLEQRRRDQGLDMTPKPQDIEDVQVKFGTAGFGDMWKNIQHSITGTSPEALARANINAINGVRGSVDGVGGKVDNLLNWFRNNRNQGGFGP
jgi:hypothetical protein